MRYRVLPLAGALLASACVERGGPPTGPSGPPPLPQSLGGTARYGERFELPGREGIGLRTFEGTVTWQREAPPDPALPPGAVRYVITASQMRAAYHADRVYANQGQAC